MSEAAETVALEAWRRAEDRAEVTGERLEQLGRSLADYAAIIEGGAS